MTGKEQVQTSVQKIHYHVMNGIHGCLPDSNERFDDLETARSHLKWIVSEMRESGLKFSGNLKEKYFECLNHNYYADIEECQESECVEEIDQ